MPHASRLPPSAPIGQEAREKVKALPLSCSTRWGSAFDQAEAILEHKTDIITVLTFRWCGLFYSTQCWTSTKAKVKMLEPIADVVKVLQECNQFLTNGMIPLLYSFVLRVISERATDPGLTHSIKAAANKMFENFEGMFDELSAAEKIAAYLDVRCKPASMDRQLRDCILPLHDRGSGDESLRD